MTTRIIYMIQSVYNIWLVYICTFWHGFENIGYIPENMHIPVYTPEAYTSYRPQAKWGQLSRVWNGRVWRIIEGFDKCRMDARCRYQLANLPEGVFLFGDNWWTYNARRRVNRYFSKIKLIKSIQQKQPQQCVNIYKYEFFG